MLEDLPKIIHVFLSSKSFFWVLLEWRQTFEYFLPSNHYFKEPGEGVKNEIDICCFMAKAQGTHCSSLGNPFLDQSRVPQE